MNKVNIYILPLTLVPVLASYLKEATQAEPLNNVHNGAGSNPSYYTVSVYLYLYARALTNAGFLRGVLYWNF
jgi:hypothetical protein